MTKVQNTFSILIADDDEEDREMIREALIEGRLSNPTTFVNDGEQLMEYLRQTDKLPGLILLDLNMPKMDGREALKEIKQDSRFRPIPVIVLTTSKTEEDIVRTYNLGVNSFVTKPVTFQSLVQVLRGIAHYWFELVELPTQKGPKR